MKFREAGTEERGYIHMNAKKIWDSYKFPLLLLGGIFTGAILGIVLGEKAKVLAPLGDIFLNLMFTIVVPMVFVPITTAVGNVVNMKQLGKILGSLVLTFVATDMFAAALVLVVVDIWPPGGHLPVRQRRHHCLHDHYSPGEGEGLAGKTYRKRRGQSLILRRYDKLKLRRSFQ